VGDGSQCECAQNRRQAARQIRDRRRHQTRADRRKRESWQLGSAQIELDTWPWIPSFVEIEAASEKELKNAADKLGFDLASAEHGSVETAYQAVYDVTEKEIDGWKEIRFIDVPGWLLEKTK